MGFYFSYKMYCICYAIILPLQKSQQFDKWKGDDKINTLLMLKIKYWKFLSRLRKTENKKKISTQKNIKFRQRIFLITFS